MNSKLLATALTLMAIGGILYLNSTGFLEKPAGNGTGQYTISLAETTTSISQYGITWTFDKEYEYGTFANGDYWIIGPVTIIGIEPGSIEVEGRTINGSMLDPTPQKDARQGFDSLASGYDSSYNVARPNGNDLSEANPLVIGPGHSLVSSISVSGSAKVQDAAVLTILGTAPAANSFRPPYAGTDKAIKFNASALDYSSLGSLAPVASTPRLNQLPGDEQADSVERMFERPWIDFQHNLGNCHPANNMPAYGANMAKEIGDGALALNLNYTNEEKETLMIRFAQLGVDLYGLLINDQGAAVGEALWRGNGGSQTGRKLPIVFAAAVLNSSEMKNAISKTGDYVYSGSYGAGNPPPDYVHFSEDDQTFYVREEDIYSQPYELNYNEFTSGGGSVTGNVKVTQGSPIVEGIGTAWLSIDLSSIKIFAVKDDIDAYMPARPFTKLDPDCISDCYLYPDYIIESIESNTQLTLANAYRGNTDQTGNAEYAISSRVWYGHGSEKYVVELDEYTNEHLGLLQWSGNHVSNPSRASLWGKSYEGVVSEALCGIALSGHIMGLEDLWNHDALFDYTDRWMEIMAGDKSRSGTDFSEEMWDAYRSQYGCVWTRNDPTDIYSLGHYDCSACLHDCMASPYCGDTSCNGSESNASCAWDCVESTECIDMPALTNYIFEWKQGNIAMPVLIQKIAEWKAREGC